MSDSTLESLVENSFYLSYYAHIQPSEVDRLTTYEFKRYVKFLEDTIKSDRDREVDLAKVSGGFNVMRSITGGS